MVLLFSLQLDKTANVMISYYSFLPNALKLLMLYETDNMA